MILGVDPGSGGALAWMDRDGNLLAIEDMPGVAVKVGKTMRKRVSGPMLAAILLDCRPSHAYIENVGPMKADGAAGAFAFGRAAGLVEGVVSGLLIPFTMVTPQSWKRQAGLIADKGAARQRAAQLFPGFAGQFARVKDDGRAESSLIAFYGVRDQQGLRGA